MNRSERSRVGPSFGNSNYGLGTETERPNKVTSTVVDNAHRFFARKTLDAHMEDSHFITGLILTGFDRQNGSSILIYQHNHRRPEIWLNNKAHRAERDPQTAVPCGKI